LQEYEKNHQLEKEEGEQLQVCCDENTPCVTNDVNDDYLSHRNAILTTATQSELVVEARGKKQQLQQQQVQNEQNHSHKGEIRHSKNTGEGELDSNEKLYWLT
jgi:hypothetical protein